MDQAQLMVGKNSAHMTKEDKLRYLEFLDKHGAFLITYSNAQVCKALNISQFSLYNYLRMIRGGKDGAAEPLPMGQMNCRRKKPADSDLLSAGFPLRAKNLRAGWRGGFCISI